MCLDKVKERGLNLEGIGYKIFRTINKGVVAQFKATPVLATEKWLHESDYREHSYKNRKKIDEIYLFGWHIYTSKKGAMGRLSCYQLWYPFVVRKVEYKQGHTVGTQDGYKVIVAKQIWIEKENLK